MEFKAKQCTNEKLGRLLLDYRMGWMTEQESSRYEREHLDKCPWCREDIILWDLSMEAIERNPSVLERHKEKRPRVAPLISKPLLAAALVLLVILGPLIYHYRSQREIPYYELRIEKAAYVPISLRDNIDIGNLSDQAKKAYEEGHYTITIENLKTILKMQPTLATAHYNLGVTYFLVGGDKQAVEELKRSIPGMEGSLREKARWYLANAYLRSGQIENCRSELGEILQSGGEYAAQAKILLDKVRIKK